MGTIYKRGRKYWIKYYRDGRPFFESSQSEKETEARRLLKLREGDVERGAPITPRAGRIRFEEIARDLITDYKINGKRSLADLERRVNNHLDPFFRGRRMSMVSTADIKRYIEERQAGRAANSQINRELAALKRAYNLALQSGKLLNKPYIPMLREDNVRRGFFERPQFEAVRSALPASLRPVIKFAYITGWRIRSEVLPLQWRQVDLEAGRVRLDPGTTKNREGREFPITAELRKLLEAQHAATRKVERGLGIVCPHVFHRNGKPIRNFYHAWKTARKTAGCPDRIPHDLRRTAVRNLVRAGIPERVAMQMTGHKTRSVFERYNIVSESDLADAGRKLDTLEAAIGG